MVTCPCVSVSFNLGLALHVMCHILLTVQYFGNFLRAMQSGVCYLSFLFSFHRSLGLASRQIQFCSILSASLSLLGISLPQISLTVAQF